MLTFVVGAAVAAAALAVWVVARLRRGRTGGRRW
jgi:hypothetical protein